MRHLLIFTSLFISLNAFPHRIISTVPSLTEMVYFLGLGDQLVGVTPHCKYPPAAKNKPKLGSSLALNYEKVIKVKPSIILLGKISSAKLEQDLGRMEIPYERFSIDRLEDIFISLARLNKLFEAGKEKEILELRTEISKTIPLKKKNILVVIGETIKNGNVISINVASMNTFYDDILKKLGQSNAINSTEFSYPHLSLEKLLRTKFDVILRIGSHDDTEAKKKWSKTIFKNQVKFLFKDYATIPGPRINLLISDIREVLL